MCVLLTGGNVAQQTNVANDEHVCVCVCVCVCVSDRWKCGSTD